MKTRSRTRYIFFFLLTLCFLTFYLPSLLANSLNISNARLTNEDTSAKTVVVEFDISWSNSWNDSTNHDAAWVFVKYVSSGAYAHALLNASGTNPTGFSTGSGTLIDIVVPTDKMGCFIERRNQGTGTLSTTNVQLVWNYGASGLTSISADVTGFKVFGIEMVYVPEGGFHAGDGSDGTAGDFEYGSGSSLPAPLNSENGISFQNVASGGWYYNASGSIASEFSSGAAFNVPTSFPKGYHAFYLMKYEVTQGQYVDFLNTLARAYQSKRVESNITGSAITNYFVMTNTTTMTMRNTITTPSNPGDTSAALTFSATSAIGAGRDNRACNYLSWMDLAAYADWVALRPITEFEFEKAARGPIYPVTDEYAWGTASATNLATISGTENGTEGSSTANAQYVSENATFSGGDASTGPVRAGIFATSSTTTRAQTGAGYYGNMELSGNVSEQVVTVGNSSGISFSGTHGDGALSSVASYEANATNLDWPGIDATSAARGVTGTAGSMTRGGDWQGNGGLGCGPETVSCRQFTGVGSTRLSYNGGRFGRTAP